MILNHLAAGYPILAIETHDDWPAINSVLGWEERGFTVRTFAADRILRGGEAPETINSYPAAFAWASDKPDRVVFVRDAQHVLNNAPIYRALLELQGKLKSHGSAVVLSAPSWQLPAELQHSCPVIHWPLPSREDLASPLDKLAAEYDRPPNGNRDAILDSAAGLTLDEAESAYALSLTEVGEFSSDIVAREKMRAIGQTGYLSVINAVPIESIGGLQRLKDYLTDEVVPSCRDTQLAVRGILLAGIPGSGKSLSAKACGSVLSWPVVRLDMSACKGSLVGQSEANIRHATQIAEAIAPCVLWLDELEKAVGGFASSAQSDGGTTLGMVGHLLTWLQEHEKHILTVATCNDYQALPSELTRAGRFDERFFVDLPTLAERVAIARVHLDRLELPEPEFYSGLIAELTDSWTGAEIEQLVKSAARLSRRELSEASITNAQQSIKPIATVQRDHIQAFRNWAMGTLRPANSQPAQQSNVASKVALAK